MNKNFKKITAQLFYNTKITFMQNIKNDENFYVNVFVIKQTTVAQAKHCKLR